MNFLRKMQADRLVNQLIAVRHHEEENGDVQRVAARIAELGPAAIPRVVEAMGTADKTQMLTFVDILTQLLSDKALPHYVEALKDPNQRVVSGVAWALTNQGYDPNRLLDLLEDEDVPRATLFQVLSAHKGRIDARALLRHAYELEPAEKDACMKLVGEMANEDLLPELLSRLTGKDPLVRVHIINILARFRRPDVQRALQNQLHDRSKIVRQAALSALAKMSDGLDVVMLCKLLEDPEIEVQNKAADVLVRINHPDTVRHLVAALKHESEYTRRSAVEVLNEIGDKDSVKDLLDALKDDDWWVRSRATDALAKIGGPRVVDAVVHLVRDQDEAIRRAAIEILNSTRDERAVKFLIEATRDEDWWVRERAVDALAEIGDSRATGALIAMLEGEAKSIPAAVRALGALGDAAALDAVMPMLDRPEKEIRVEAVKGLVKLADEAHAQAIMERIHGMTVDSDNDVRQAALRARTDMDERFSATAIAANLKAAQLAEPSRTLLIDVHEGMEAARAEQKLDISKLEVGDVIENRYKFIQQIGRGAFGTVILVEDTVVAERLVLKFINPSISVDDEMMQRFVHELRYSRKITHKNVIRIYDFVHLGGLYAISMEYFPSRSISSEMAAKKPLKLDRAIRLTRDMAAGMSAAHQVGIIHRDLKPANVLVNDDDLVKVVDFGVAAAAGGGDTQLTKTGYVIGSPKYMAPEQILGKKVDQRADIYSLGVILYELLTGSPPYSDGDHMSVMYQHVQGNARPVAEVNRKVTPELAAVATRAMAVDKLHRYQTMEEFGEALDGLME